MYLCPNVGQHSPREERVPAQKIVKNNLIWSCDENNGVMEPLSWCQYDSILTGQKTIVNYNMMIFLIIYNNRIIIWLIYYSYQCRINIIQYYWSVLGNFSALLKILSFYLKYVTLLNWFDIAHSRYAGVIYLSTSLLYSETLKTPISNFLKFRTYETFSN